MAADERTDEPARETVASSSTFRRRGLIAGAAALVVGLAARSAEPVGANPPPLVGTNNFSASLDSNADGVQGYASGVNNAGVFGRNNDFNGVGVWGAGTNGNGVYGQSQQGTGVAGNSSSGFGVGGQSTSNTGVSGYSTGGVGVQGKSASNVGVFGLTADNSAPAIQGLANGNSIAVNGLARGSNTAVYGQGNTGSGVAGYTSSSTYAAVVGNGNANVSGVQGYTSSTTFAAITGNTAASPGVYGQSNSAIGVSGESGSGAAVSGVSATYYGVYGSSTSSHGVVGASAGSGTAGINGYTNAPNAYAALFTGPVGIADGAVSVYNGTQTNTPLLNANTHGIVRLRAVERLRCGLWRRERRRERRHLWRHDLRCLCGILPRRAGGDGSEGSGGAAPGWDAPHALLSGIAGELVRGLRGGNAGSGECDGGAGCGLCRSGRHEQTARLPDAACGGERLGSDGAEHDRVHGDGRERGEVGGRVHVSGGSEAEGHRRAPLGEGHAPLPPGSCGADGADRFADPNAATTHQNADSHAPTGSETAATAGHRAIGRGGDHRRPTCPERHRDPSCTDNCATSQPMSA